VLRRQAWRAACASAPSPGVARGEETESEREAAKHRLTTALAVTQSRFGARRRDPSRVRPQRAARGRRLGRGRARSPQGEHAGGGHQRVPGGAGVGIKAARGGANLVEGALDTVTTGDKVLDAAKGGRAAEAGQAGGRAAEASPQRGIYEFPDQTAGGKPYIGQSGNIPERLNQHEAAGRLTPGTETTKAVEGNKTAREVAEHKRIQEVTGGVPARKSPDVANKVDPIGPARKHLLE
jgi:hypothetical protein